MAVLRKKGNLWTLSCSLRTLPQSIAAVLLLVTILCAPAIQAVDEPVTYIIEEELPAGSLIGNIVVDSKLNQKYTQAVLNNLRYSYLTQSDNRDLFDLDERTGDLSAAVNLDRDVICPKLTLCKISLDVAVQPVEYFEAIKIFITILDLNDNAPAFPQEAMASSLSESTVPGILFPIPTATDNDSPEFGVKRYEFVSDTNKFELQMRNTSDGTVDLHLALKGQLDHEEDNAYEMKVIAWDGGNPPRSGTITIDIQVVDINDNSPQFLNASYEARVPEDTRPNTTIIKVTARDPDTGTNGEIEYSFTARTLRAYGNIFGINLRSGEIYIKQALDYEDTTSYNLGVTAQDRGADSLPTPTKVIVNVVDINDHAPQITINSLTGSENAEVPENEPAPYFVAHISVYDPDGGKNGQFNCSLDNNYFQLVQLYDTEFKVMAIAVLDREAHALHDIRIKCADMGNPPQRTTAHLMVDVMDANDNTPIFRQETYFATLNENNELGEVVTQVQATDQDAGANGQIRYELHEDGRKYFQIDPKTGVIRANVEFDREETSNLEFRVLASDLGEDSHTATTTVLLTIMDENDEEPRFTLQRFVFNVEENVPINTEVGQVTAADGDLPPNNQFFFEIVSSDVSEVFELDPKNGVITTLRPLDRETKDVYSMVAMVYSKNRNQRNHTARIVIYVDDENDNAPLIDFPREDNNTVYLSNQVPIGYVVTKISAHDLDYGANQKLMYHLSESSDDGAFHIGESTGEVYVNRKFDGVKEEIHKLVVMVKDNGYPQRISIANLHIVVNESVPYRPHAGASSSRNSNHVSDIQMIIIICVVLGTVILATLLVVAIVVLKRRESKQNSPKFVHKTELTFAAAKGADTESCDKLPAAPPLTAPTGPPLTDVGGNKGPDGIYVPKPNPHTVPDVAIAGAGGDHRHHYHHPGGEHEDDEMGSVDGGKVSFEMQSPASTEKDSDSGCCADMSNHEDNGNHLHMNGGPGSILRKGHHPHGHPHQGPSPVGGGPPTARKPPSRQSSFSDWLAQESQNLRQSGHVYRVNNAQKTVRFNEENPGTAGPSSGIHGSIPEEGIPIDNDEVPPPAPPPGPGYQNQVYQNGHSLGGVGAPGGAPLPLYPQHQQSAGGPGKIHFVPSQAYRNYGHIGNDIIPEEPENLQYDLPPPPPPTADWNDGSLV